MPRPAHRLRCACTAFPTPRMAGGYWRHGSRPRAGGWLRRSCGDTRRRPLRPTAATTPSRAFWPRRGHGLRRSLLALLPAQALRSWYTMYFQLPWLPEQSKSWILPLLWRRWSPGFDASEDLRHVDAAIGSPQSWRAALGPYRATARPGKPPAQYAELERYWQRPLRLPTLYLHGADDGCLGVKLADRARTALPPDGAMHVVHRAGHFLQPEQPDVVAGRILDFIGHAG